MDRYLKLVCELIQMCDEGIENALNYLDGDDLPCEVALVVRHCDILWADRHILVRIANR